MYVRVVTITVVIIVLKCLMTDCILISYPLKQTHKMQTSSFLFLNFGVICSEEFQGAYHLSMKYSFLHTQCCTASTTPIPCP